MRIRRRARHWRRRAILWRAPPPPTTSRQERVGAGNRGAGPGLDVARLIVLRRGQGSDLKQRDLVKLGGIVMGQDPRHGHAATIVADLPSRGPSTGSGG